jgi:hypothetical protein
MKSPLDRPHSDSPDAAPSLRHAGPSSLPEVGPVSPGPEYDDGSDDDFDAPTDDDDAKWDAFLADDDELDPLPDYGDFWLDQD